MARDGKSAIKEIEPLFAGLSALKNNDCPGGKQNCRDCGTNVSMISPEELLKGSNTNINLCGDSACGFCGECGGERKR